MYRPEDRMIDAAAFWYKKLDTILESLKTKQVAIDTLLMQMRTVCLGTSSSKGLCQLVKMFDYY